MKERGIKMGGGGGGGRERNTEEVGQESDGDIAMI